MNQSFIALLSFLLGGGSGDLLNYVQTRNYWEGKDVQVTVETMLQEAAPPATPDISKQIADLGATDPQTRDLAAASIFKLGAVALPALRKAAADSGPEITDRSEFLIQRLEPSVPRASVRRLMALRTLGELKNPAAVPYLTSQLGSQEMFVSDYARAAIAQIDGEPTTRPVVTHPIDAIRMLPSNCAAVMQITPKQTGAMDLTAAAARLHPAHGPDGPAVLSNFSNIALSVAEAMGNMRLDTLSVGLSDDLGASQGCVTLIAGGEFSSANAARVARDHGAAMRKAEGTDIFESGREGTMFFPSDHLMVLMLSPTPEATPLKEVLDAVKARTQPHTTSPRIAALVQPMMADSQKPHSAWIAATITDAYRVLPGVERLNAITLAADEENGALNYTLRGQSSGVAGAAATVDKLNGYAGLAVASFQARPEQDALSNAVLDFLSTMRFQSDGAAVTGTASLPLSQDAILARFLALNTLLGPSR